MRIGCHGIGHRNKAAPPVSVGCLLAMRQPGDAVASTVRVVLVVVSQPLSWWGESCGSVRYPELLVVLALTVKNLNKTVITIMSLVSIASVMNYAGMIGVIASALVAATGIYGRGSERSPPFSGRDTKH